MAEIACPLCQSPLEIQYTKKEKPYLTCEKDGLQMFVRYEAGIRRLNQLSKRKACQMDKFVVCKDCDVAVKRSRSKIQEPFFGRAGLFCPECGELLMEAPTDWKKD